MTEDFRFHSTSILLIEDNPADVRLTVELLREAKLANRLHAIRDGAEALAYLRGQGPHPDWPLPDLILLDLDLPGAPGRAILKEIKASPALRHIPVFVLSSTPVRLAGGDSAHHGAAGYLVKPIDLPQFISAVVALDRFWLELVCAP